MSTKTVEKKTSVRNGVRRLSFAAVAILLQVIWLVGLISKLNQQYPWISLTTTLLVLILVLRIYSQHKTSSMKMPWIILILVFPVLGVSLYLLLGRSGVTRRMQKRYETIDQKLFPMLPQNREALLRLKEQDGTQANLARYIQTYAGYPVYDNTDVEFYDDAARGLEAQKEALKRAEKFIFMEYHAIEDAESWWELQEILVEKVKEGVEVRLFYDDMGSIGFINTDFVKKMKAFGMQCRVFNPMLPFINVFLNNRDHRKITVVDGHVGFTGGYNLANEYFNITHPYGHWKDTGIKLTGEAVKSLTVTFLEMWNAVNVSDKDDTNMERYFSDVTYRAGIPDNFITNKKLAHPAESAEITGDQNFQSESGKWWGEKGRGWVQPYADSPMDDEQTGENVYMNLISGAKEYIYFMTPYLIITDEMNHALGLAAKRGVDVRIITPGIPDKKLVYKVTRSYYAGLVRNGVRIYEYTPGFCHAKQCVCDDRIATCGTINLDYRSLYHHFENGCVLYNCRAVLDVKQDFEVTFSKCREVTEQYRTGMGAMLRMGQCFLRLFAELL